MGKATNLMETPARERRGHCRACGRKLDAARIDVRFEVLRSDDTTRKGGGRRTVMSRSRMMCEDCATDASTEMMMSMDKERDQR